MDNEVLLKIFEIGEENGELRKEIIYKKREVKVYV